MQNFLFMLGQFLLPQGFVFFKCSTISQSKKLTIPKLSFIMAANHKSYDAFNLDMPKRGFKLLLVSESVNVLNLRKKNHMVAAINYLKNKSSIVHNFYYNYSILL